jgi:hypothetical protein
MSKVAFKVDWTDTNDSEDLYEIQVSTDSPSMVNKEYDENTRLAWMDIGKAAADAETFEFELDRPLTYVRVRVRANKEGSDPSNWVPTEGYLLEVTNGDVALSDPTGVLVTQIDEANPGNPPDEPDPIPSAITDLAVDATPSVDGSLTVTFTAVDDGTGNPAKYRIRYQQGSTIQYATASEVTSGTCNTSTAPLTIGAAVSCTITGLLEDTEYTVQAQSYRGTLNTDAVLGWLSNPDQGTTSGSAPTILPAPTNPSPTNTSVSPGSITFSWGAVTGADDYFLRVHKQGQPYTPTDSTSNFPFYGSVSGTSQNVTLEAGATYDWWVVARDGSVEGASQGGLVTVTPVSATWPDQPAGLTQVTDYNLSTAPLGDGSNAVSGWRGLYGGSRVQVVSDATAPFSPSNVARFDFNGLAATGSSPGSLYYEPGGNGWVSCYYAFYWKFTSNFRPHSSNVNKVSFIIMGNDFAASLIPSLSGGPGSWNLRWGIAGHGITNDHIGGLPGDSALYFPVNGSSNSLQPDTWYLIEQYTVKSTSTTSQDGTAKLWINRNLVFNYTNVNTPTRGFVKWELNPTWGGVDTSGVTGQGYFFYDHVYVSVGAAA